MIQIQTSIFGGRHRAKCDCGWVGIAGSDLMCRLMASAHQITHDRSDDILEQHDCIAVRDIEADNTYYLAKRSEADGPGWHIGLGAGRLHYPNGNAAADALELGLDPICGEGEY